jgi:hypothetical protein
MRHESVMATSGSSTPCRYPCPHSYGLSDTGPTAVPDVFALANPFAARLRCLETAWDRQRALGSVIRIAHCRSPRRRIDGGAYLGWIGNPSGARGPTGIRSNFMSLAPGPAHYLVDPQGASLLDDESEVMGQMLDRTVDHLAHRPLAPIANDSRPLPRLRR